MTNEKCNGCGLCATACHESAIAIVNGKAKLIRDDYCDGLGNCLPACPTNAISFEEREALAYDDDAVKETSVAKSSSFIDFDHPCCTISIKSVASTNQTRRTQCTFFEKHRFTRRR